MDETTRSRMRAIALRRLHLIPVSIGEPASKMRLVLLAEMASLGYRVENPEAFNRSALEAYDEVVTTLKEMRGGDVEYVPLFQGFPDNVPEENEYFARRVIGYLGNVIGCFDEGRPLANGVIVPERLFDLSEFGADPILQFQDQERFEKGVATQSARDADSVTQWIQLRFAPWDEIEAEAKQFLQRHLYAKSSIKDALKPEIEFLLDYFGSEAVDPMRLVFKETRTYVMKYYWARSDFEALRPLCSTPTDLLRMFAAVTETDISLTEPVKFPKLRRAERRFLLGVLENCTNLIEDLVAYKGLCLEIGRFLHPGEYQRQYPKTYAAFDAIRNGTAETYNSQVEKAIESRDVAKLVRLLEKRPGVFARRVHHTLELAAGNYQSVLDAFRVAAIKVPLKNLLVLETYLKTIEDSQLRTIINKRGRIRVMPNRMGRLTEGALDGCLAILRQAILEKIQADKPSGKARRFGLTNNSNRTPYHCSSAKLPMGS